MEKIKSKTLAILIPIVVFVVALVFSFVYYPMINQEVREVPVAILNLDEGVAEQNLGEQIVTNLSEQSGDKIKWIEVANQEALEQGFDDQEYYASLTIPADYTQKMLSLSTANPTAPSLAIEIDQGQNPTMASSVETILSTMTDGLNQNLQETLLAAYSQAPTISSEMAATLVSPISVETTYRNEVADGLANGNAHRGLFLTVWMTTFITSILFYLFLSKVKSHKNLWALGAIPLSCLVGLAVWTMGSVVLGLSLPFWEVFGFVSLTALCLMTLIVGTLNLCGMKGVFVFVVILLLGMMASNLPYETLPTFWRDWIYPWVPTRFIAEGLNDILYLGSGVFNASLAGLAWFGVAGVVLYAIGAWRSRRKGEPKRLPAEEPQA